MGRSGPARNFGESNGMWAGTAAGYMAVHERLYARRGPARDYPCITCGNPAQQWAYQHGDPDERVNKRGQAFTSNLDAYAPMCIRCHRSIDDYSARRAAS